MQFNPHKLGLAAAFASLLYQGIMLAATMILAAMYGQNITLAGIAGVSLVGIPVTCILHYAYAFIVAKAYNKLMS
jgi:hypothetical protein